MGSKINLLAMLAAAGAFFLPWLEVSCTGKDKEMVMFHQTGVQVMTGKVTLGEEMQELEDGVKSVGGMLGAEDESGGVKKSEADPAFLVGLAAALVGLGVLFALVAAGGRGETGLVGLVAAGALALIAAQMALKFPAVQEDSDGEEERAMAEAMREVIKERYEPGLYVELGALAVPVLVMLGGVGRRKG